MRPNFSLYYEGSFFDSEKTNGIRTEAGTIYEICEGVTVTLATKEYKKYDAIEWVLYFENTKAKDSCVISDIRDCDTILPMELPAPPAVGHRREEGDLCIITMNGTVNGRYYWESDRISSTEYGLFREYLDEKIHGGVRSFSNIGGRSSDGTVPIFDITASDGGYISAIGWSGDWKAEFSVADGGVRMKSGLRQTHFYLKAGEKLRTSSVLVMKYESDDDKYNKFRHLIKEHFSHKSCTGTQREGLMAAELWGGLPSVEMKKRLSKFKEYDICFEDVWIDAGWYGRCMKCDEPFSGDWAAHTGEWEINERVHPDGLTDVARCAADAGMKLMLWFEPERASFGTKVRQDHPEWFLTCPNTDNGILYYGNDEAFEYITEVISGYIEKLELSCYRQDFNTELTEFFGCNDAENRRGITEIKHITGMYRLWDTLLERYPGLIIDNCSSGGRRIDIETLKRSIPFFRSDYQCNFNENPEVLQTHNSNISKYLPYNGCTSKTKADTYAARSSYSSSWGGAFYNAVFQRMDDSDFKWAKKITDEYRRIRKYMSCDFYSHGSDTFDDTSWAIWQYHNAHTESGIVMAFRRSRSPFDSVTVNLSGMRGKNVRYTDFNDGSTFDGDEKLTIRLSEKRSSVIFEYEKR